MTNRIWLDRAGAACPDKNAGAVKTASNNEMRTKAEEFLKIS
jgi:hypothetical protein